MKINSTGTGMGEYWNKFTGIAWKWETILKYKNFANGNENNIDWEWEEL